MQRKNKTKVRNKFQEIIPHRNWFAILKLWPTSISAKNGKNRHMDRQITDTCLFILPTIAQAYTRLHICTCFSVDKENDTHHDCC